MPSIPSFIKKRIDYSRRYSKHMISSKKENRQKTTISQRTSKIIFSRRRNSFIS
jgi:hypothetical protein